MSHKIIASIHGTSKTTTIKKRLLPHLQLRSDKDYKISLINFTFTNIFQNISGSYGIHFIIILNINGTPTTFEVTDTIDSGLYEINDILNILNSHMHVKKYISTANEEHYLAKFELDIATARVVLTCDPIVLALYDGYVGFQNLIPGHIMQTHIIEFQQDFNIIFDYEHPELYKQYVSTKMPSVSEVNSYVLTSNVVNFPAYTENSVGDEDLIVKNVLYSFPANINRYEFKNFTSIMPLVYDLSNGQQSLTDVLFELKDQNGNQLSYDPLDDTDLSIYIQLLEYDK